MAGTRNSTTQGVNKAVRLLNCFATARTEAVLSVSELSALTGWTESTVSRLLSALQDGGLVERDPSTGRYKPGLQLVALAGAALASHALYPTGHASVLRLAQASGETANLCVLQDGQVLTIDEALGAHPIKFSGWVGIRHPLHATAAGKVLLAGMPEEGRRALIAGTDLAAITPHTITHAERLLRELERVEVEGYALNLDELSAGLTAVAAPVRDHTDTVVAALTLAGPSFRLSHTHLTESITIVIEEAAAASRALGNRIPVALVGIEPR